MQPGTANLFAVLLLTTTLLNAAPTFAPLTQWKSAVIAGDKQALARLYSTNPPSTIQAGQQKSTLEDELAFWTNLKTAGIHDFDPKLLEISTRNNATTLVLRVLAVRSDGTHVVAGAMQIWAKQEDAWRIVAAQRSNFSRDAARQLPQPEVPDTELYSDPANARAELAAAAKSAKKEGKRVLVVFGGNWCYDCHVLDTAFNSPAFKPLIKANYELVHINIGEDGRANNDIAAETGVSLDKGVPALAVLDPDGTVIFGQKDGAFESTVRIGPADIEAFLEKWKPARR